LDVTEAEAELLLSTLDPLAALARPDAPTLAALLERFRTSNEAVADLLEGLARSAGLPLSGLVADPDEVPDTPPPRTSPGDVWRLGHHVLACVDATQEGSLAALVEDGADALVTDPPYGVGYAGKTPRRLTISGDDARALRTLLAGAFAKVGRALKPGAPLYVFAPAGPGYATFMEAFAAQGWEIRQGLAWMKDSAVIGRGDYHYMHEPILFGYAPGPHRRGRGRGGWYGGNNQTSVLQVPRPKRSAEHPTMKPVELLRRLISNSTRRGQTVLDPFVGSGSTLIACESLERRCIATEISPEYCDVVLARFEALTGTPARRATVEELTA
jgi:DNA modification methylase